MNPKSKKLFALTTAALALPGMTPKSLVAQTAPEDFNFSYRYSKYAEAAQAADNNQSGEDVERYEIDVHQIGFVAPILSRFSLNLDASTESMSGASPWFVLEGDDGEPVQVMSGASIEESRDDVAISANYYSDRFRVGVGSAQSEENDYESKSTSLNASVWFNSKNTSIDFSLNESNDEIAPTRAPTIDPNRVLNETKESKAFSIGFSQVINKTLLVGGGFSFSEYYGFLSDPYKLASVNGVLLRDNRPDTKTQTSTDFRIRKYFSGIAAALHTDYRFYDNDWGAISHTLSLGWYQNLGSWQLSLRVRGYDQTAANFFQNFYAEERADGYHSSDYRLSSYSAVSTKLGLKKDFERSAFIVTFENYQTGEGSDSEADLSPGLVDFNLVTAGFDLKF